jgi:polysaccharide deacetylase 2 family uncharacterized protein YibQ
MTPGRLGTLRFEPVRGEDSVRARNEEESVRARSEKSVRARNEEGVRPVRVMRRPGRRRRRWMRRLRHLLMERRFAAAQLSFGVIGAIAGLWLLWPRDDLQIREQQELWQQSLESTSLGKADQIAVDSRSTSENARRPHGVASARIQGDGLPPAIAAGLAISAKKQVAGSSALAEASPQQSRSERVAIATSKITLPDRAMPDVGATSEIAKPQGAPAALAVALPDRVKPLEPGFAEAPEVQVESKPRTDVAAVPVLRPPALPPAPVGTPTWLRNAVTKPLLDDRPAIVVVLDDLGMNRANTAELNQLKAPLTLAFLPYAGALERQTKAARAAGHELLLHVPMEPVGKEWPGPGALISSLDDQEMLRRLRMQLQSFDGFVGINNHMGSLLTTDRRRMALVMAELHRRGLLFLDSRTTGASVAAAEAHRVGVPHAVRDVFLDNDLDAPHIHHQLAAVERVARRHGMAIAIGHPHDATIAALRHWLPTLEAKGFALVPISTIVARRACAEGLAADVCGSLHLAAREVETGTERPRPTPARFLRD